MQTATNQETGQKVAFVGGEWKPIEQTATNAQGVKAYLVGGAWMQDEQLAKPRIPPNDTGEREAARLQGVTGAELIAGSAPGRFVLGAASPFIGAAQLVGNALGVGESEYNPFSNQRVQQLEEMKRRGMEAQPNAAVNAITPNAIKDADIAGFAGSMVSPAAIGAMRLAPAATKIGRIGQGAAIGAGFGASAPVTEGGDSFWTNKAAQTGMGAGIGLAIPGGIEGAKGVYQLGRNVLQPWLPGKKGVDLAVGRTLNKAAGSDREAIIAEMLKPDIVPGSMPGAGEKAANIGRTEFSAIQEAVKGRDPTPWARLAGVQEGARQTHIGTFAGDRTKLADALKARDTQANEAYGAVRGDRINLKSDADIMADAIAGREAAQTRALQDTWRFRNTAAQQERLAQGGTIPLSWNQPLGEPTLARGIGGGTARSPSAWPVEGQPRIPARYTENRDRVSEALSAADDASAVVALRGKERDFLITQADILKQTVGLSDESIADLLSRPSMVEGLKDAAKSAAEKGAYFPTKPGEKLTVGNLQRIKESLDAGIKAAQSKTVAGVRPDLSPAELTNTKQLFVKLLSEKSPGWRDARQEFAEASRGTNQMEIGQELQKRLTDATGKETAGKFLSAVDERTEDAITKLVKSAVTGKPRYTTLDEALTPQNAQVIRDVVADVLRSVKHQQNTVAGAERAREIIGQIAPKVPAAGMFSPNYSVTRTVLNRIGGLAEGKSLDRMNEVMRDPKMTAKLMKAATPSERALIANEWAGKGSRFATIATALGAAQGD